MINECKKKPTGDNDTIRRRHRAVTSHPDNRLRGKKIEGKKH